MNGATIAAADDADIPELIKLLRVLFSIEQDFTPDPDRQRRGLAALLASPMGHVAIARDATGQYLRILTVLFFFPSRSESTSTDSSHRTSR